MEGRRAMKELRTALEEYLNVRRMFGFKLRIPGSLLRNFVTYADFTICYVRGISEGLKSFDINHLCISKNRLINNNHPNFTRRTLPIVCPG
jgi:hypothetical protein